MINWDATKKDMALIDLIAERAMGLARRYKLKRAKIDYHMDIAACHLNGCPLDLVSFATTDDFNFAHDISGIANNIDRETGKLQNCFLPRFAK